MVIQEKTQNRLQYFLIGCGAIAGLYGVILLVRSVINFADSRAFVWDAGLYLGVGRSMLNGLIPYRDLYENKPPGIFVLSALSLKFLGSGYLGNVLGALTLLFMPLATFLGLRSVNAEKRDRMVLIVSGALAGGVWALFLAENIGPWQTELFGSLFAAIYVVLLFTPRTYWTIAGLTLSLACAVAFKEPFLFACAGAALLTVKKPRDFLWTFLVPAAIVLIGGSLLMAALGYLGAYIDIYLPALMSFRGERYGPILLRGFGFNELATVLFHSSVLLPLTTAFVVGSLLVPIRSRKTSTIITTIVRVALGLYLTLLAVGLPGDFQSHHFGFFTPFFLVAVIAMYRQSLPRWFTLTMLGLWICTVATIYIPHDFRQSAEAVMSIKEAALSMDTVLDRCGLDRYLQVNPGVNKLPLFAYTEHSPLNHSLFLQIDNAIQYGQYFLDESVKRLSQAQVIAFPLGEFAPSNDVGVDMFAYITQTFTQNVPDCALPLPATPEYTLLFRSDPAPFNLDIDVIDGR